MLFLGSFLTQGTCAQYLNCICIAGLLLICMISALVYGCCLCVCIYVSFFDFCFVFILFFISSCLLFWCGFFACLFAKKKKRRSEVQIVRWGGSGRR